MKEIQYYTDKAEVDSAIDHKLSPVVSDLETVGNGLAAFKTAQESANDELVERLDKADGRAAEITGKISVNATELNKLPSTADVSAMIQQEHQFRAVLSFDEASNNFNVISGGDYSAYHLYTLDNDYKIKNNYDFDFDGKVTWGVIPQTDNFFLVILDGRDKLVSGNEYDFDLTERKWSASKESVIVFTPEQIAALNSGITTGLVGLIQKHSDDIVTLNDALASERIARMGADNSLNTYIGELRTVIFGSNGIPATPFTDTEADNPYWN